MAETSPTLMACATALSINSNHKSRGARGEQFRRVIPLMMILKSCSTVIDAISLIKTHPLCSWFPFNPIWTVERDFYDYSSRVLWPSAPIMETSLATNYVSNLWLNVRSICVVELSYSDSKSAPKVNLNRYYVPSSFVRDLKLLSTSYRWLKTLLKYMHEAPLNISNILIWRIKSY